MSTTDEESEYWEIAGHRISRFVMYWYCHRCHEAFKTRTKAAKSPCPVKRP